MSYRLINNIDHTEGYNAGGVSNIYLLDADDFVSYVFRDDELFNGSYVDQIKTRNSFIEVSSISESSFSETYENSIYKQSLNTFVRSVEGDKTHDLLLARYRKHIVVFRTHMGRMYTFGAEGGASVSFTQTTGEEAASLGYKLSIGKNSEYPLFEINPDKFNSVDVLSTEDLQVVMTEDETRAIRIEDWVTDDNCGELAPDDYDSSLDQEYKFYIDEVKDAVLMYPVNRPCALPELPQGLERAIALRYINLRNRKVLKSWSEIQAEANKIRSEIKG